MSDEAPFVHRTVMRDEVVRAIAPRAGGLYADVTLGGGGHAEALLEGAPDTTLIGLDRDETAIAAARTRLARFGDRVRIVHAVFGEAAIVLPPVTGGRLLDGIVADIGVSSPQLDDPARGMSFRREASSAPIDMRMDRSTGRTARELIESISQEDLANLLFELGEERRSRKIARSIKMAFDANKLDTTGDLRHAIYAAIGGGKEGGLDPATRTFQALRIAVNDELGELDRLLDALPKLLAEDGIAAIISFHSLEDGRVKRAFSGDAWAPLQKRPLVAGDVEVEDNPRARSAKLRAARLRRVSESKDDRASRYAARRARKWGSGTGEGGA
ncbi:MAG: 16S rRNA (cytosine(1402)-N(4))-methyltransferase RsmH [Polyangiales bacterium]